MVGQRLKQFDERFSNLISKLRNQLNTNYSFLLIFSKSFNDKSISKVPSSFLCQNDGECYPLVPQSTISLPFVLIFAILLSIGHRIIQK